MIRGLSRNFFFRKISKNLCYTAITSRKSNYLNAIHNAEKEVGCSTSYFLLRCLLSHEITSLRDFVGTNVLLEMADVLTKISGYSTYIRGLIILLISKSLECGSEADKIHAKQKILAEMTEMINSAYLINRSLSDFDSYKSKLSILSADFLLANAWKGLCDIGSTHVVELMTNSITDITQGQFLEELHNKELNESLLSIELWEDIMFLTKGSLQAYSCMSTVVLAGKNEFLQEKAFEFGKYLALSLQIFDEMKLFLTDYDGKFDICCVPVIKALESNAHININNVSFEKLHSLVGKHGLEKSRDLKNSFVDKAYDAIQFFPSSTSHQSLLNILCAIKEY